ncbi:MAG TPA: von Willebrand factor type A domain-containing protein [Patescibacteria group bacterium]|nr:von Willebrand factor type A domain-containing protein [Patescibacteria group bacterium]
MSSEFPTDPRKALEASLTALLLKELPEDQARFLRQAIATDPELARTFERLKQTIALVREAQPAKAEPEQLSPALTLSSERRTLLLQCFKTVRSPVFAEPVQRSSWLLPVAASGALLVALAGLLLPTLSRSKSRSFAQRSESNIRRLAATDSRSDRGRPLEQTVTSSFGYSKELLSKNGNRKDQLPEQLTPAAPPTELPSEQSKRSLLENGIVLPAEQKPSSVTLGMPQTSTANLDFYALSQPATPDQVPSTPQQYLDSTFTFSQQGGLGGGRNPTLGDEPTSGRLFQATQKDDKAGVQKSSTGLSSEPWGVTANPRGYYNDGFFGSYSTPSPAAPSQSAGAKNSPSSAGEATTWSFAQNTEKGQSAAGFEGRSDIRLFEPIPGARDAEAREGDTMKAPKLLTESQVATERSLTAGKELNVVLDETKQKSEKETLTHKMSRLRDSFGDALAEKSDLRAKIAQGQLIDQNAIDQDKAAGSKSVVSPVIPQPEVQTRSNSFSTFSLNVSDVSFKLAAASLEKGFLPDPSSIRSEEFINAFDYRDPEPGPGAAVAFAFERCQYPFTQNRDLVRFSIKTGAIGRQNGRPLNLVLLLDNSGSMERADRVRIIREALRVLAAQLQTQDTFSVVTFARTARLWVDGVAGDQAAKTADELSSLTPQGGTNLEEAMDLAYQTALRHYSTNGINRVVLLTDGAANLGNTAPDVLKRKVEANRRQGIALDCFGIGWEGYNDDLLEQLTRNGDGRYGFINNPEEAASGFASQLAGALQVAASDVKVQVEFNPNRVTSYRQIGYARHQLTKEQFRDNTVDAAELGAAEAGNALYVIECNSQGEGPLATVRVRYKVPGTTDYRELEWTVPFTGAGVALDQASPAMRLAASASAFSEWLGQNPFALEIMPERLLGLLNGVPAFYGVDPRPQKLEWMIRQAKALSGK